MGWNYLSIPKLQRLHHWSLGMDEQFHPTLHNGCNYLSMLGLKFIHVSKRSLNPLILVKSLQLIWRLGPHKWNLQVPNVQKSPSDLTVKIGNQDSSPSNGHQDDISYIWYCTQHDNHIGKTLVRLQTHTKHPILWRLRREYFGKCDCEISRVYCITFLSHTHNHAWLTVTYSITNTEQDP